MDFDFIINRQNELCKVNPRDKFYGGVQYIRTTVEGLNIVSVDKNGRFTNSMLEHKYDIVEKCTPKTHPELYL